MSTSSAASPRPVQASDTSPPAPHIGPQPLHPQDLQRVSGGAPGSAGTVTPSGWAWH